MAVGQRLAASTTASRHLHFLGLQIALPYLMLIKKKGLLKGFGNMVFWKGTEGKGKEKDDISNRVSSTLSEVLH